MLRQINLIFVNYLAPALPPPAVVPAMPAQVRGMFVDPLIDPDHGMEPLEPRYQRREDRRDNRRDEPYTRVATAALILEWKVEMHQKKIRHIYLVEAICTIKRMK